MRSDEARIAEAIAALAHRLETWGIDDAAEKAQTYVTDMVRNGWRPRALPATPPPTPAGCKPTADYLAARGKTAPIEETDHA